MPFPQASIHMQLMLFQYMPFASNWLSLTCYSIKFDLKIGNILLNFQLGFFVEPKSCRLTALGPQCLWQVCTSCILTHTSLSNFLTPFYLLKPTKPVLITYIWTRGCPVPSAWTVLGCSRTCRCVPGRAWRGSSCPSSVWRPVRHWTGTDQASQCAGTPYNDTIVTCNSLKKNASNNIKYRLHHF